MEHVQSHMFLPFPLDYSEHSPSSVLPIGHPKCPHPLHEPICLWDYKRSKDITDKLETRLKIGHTQNLQKICLAIPYETLEHNICPSTSLLVRRKYVQWGFAPFKPLDRLDGIIGFPQYKVEW